MEDRQLLQRVARYEEIFDRGLKAVGNLQQALEAYDNLLPQLQELEAYYEGGQWQQDYAADERGEIPRDFKRGVLSEDGVWNLLTELDALKARIKDAPLGSPSGGAVTSSQTGD